MPKATKRHRQSWSDQDVTTLAKKAATESVEFVAQALQRTVAAVRAKAGEIGAAFGGPKKARAKPARSTAAKKPAKRTTRKSR